MGFLGDGDDMATDCCSSGCSRDVQTHSRYRKVLWAALLVNTAMFAIELLGGLHAASASLLADAIDFLGDAANYGLSLAVLTQGLQWRSRAALAKGLTMGMFGLFVLGRTGWMVMVRLPPEPSTMAMVAFLALAANLGVAILFYAYRSGDANMRSLWLCTRNDVVGNILVLLAALAIFLTGQAWPDRVVAGVMGTLGLMTAISIVRRARQELRPISVTD